MPFLIADTSLGKTFLISGFNTPEHESKRKEEQMMEISFMKIELNVFSRATIEERSGTVHFMEMV